MHLNILTPVGLFQSETGSLRTLLHPQGDIQLLDHIFEQTFIDYLYHNLNLAPYIADDYDNQTTRHISHLKCELPAQELISGTGLGQQAPQLAIVATVIFELLQRLYPDYQHIAVQRIHVNNIPYGDLLSNHVDGPTGQALTGLYFANAEWRQSWGGELIICDPNEESLYAIEPRPGRIVLFPGDIFHRAGAPTRLCFARRLSIGHKFSAQKIEAASA